MEEESSLFVPHPPIRNCDAQGSITFEIFCTSRSFSVDRLVNRTCIATCRNF
jgi:hypothetical protein